ncbi:hypothetical protein DFH27DRAFT_635727 [Peziza echinospora]|nr:hypothetical protein DFH27DRAFT_635727 [Peziza echinospora]
MKHVAPGIEVDAVGIVGAEFFPRVGLPASPPPADAARPEGVSVLAECGVQEASTAQRSIWDLRDRMPPAAGIGHGGMGLARRGEAAGVGLRQDGCHGQPEEEEASAAAMPYGDMGRAGGREEPPSVDWDGTGDDPASSRPAFGSGALLAAKGQSAHERRAAPGSNGGADPTDDVHCSSWDASEMSQWPRRRGIGRQRWRGWVGVGDGWDE